MRAELLFGQPMAAAREDVLANILHVISFSTETIPIFYCAEDGVDRLGASSNSNGYDDDNRQVQKTGTEIWLDRNLRQISYFQNAVDDGGTALSDEHTILQLEQVMCAMMEENSYENMDKNNGGLKKRNDDLLWQAGLILIQRILNDNDAQSHAEEYKTFSEGTAIDDSGELRSKRTKYTIFHSQEVMTSMSDEPIAPHILLRSVIDSYYYNDNHGNAESLQVTDTPSQCRLPTSFAMFYLRTILASHAIAKATEVTRQSLAHTNSSPSTPSTVIRWRRLKSMADDTLFLFRRMLLDHAGKTAPTDHGLSSNAEEQPLCLISLATRLYIYHIFPSCRGLLSLLLDKAQKGTSDTSPVGSLFFTKTLESCYHLFFLSTSLLALKRITCNDTGSMESDHLLMKHLIDQSTSDFYSVVLVAGRNCPPENDGADDVESERQDTFCLSKNIGRSCSERGRALDEDMLLFKSLREKHKTDGKHSFDHRENLAESSEDMLTNCPFDELGIAVVAFSRLQAQSNPISSTLESLPCPYSGNYLWTLLFPHVATLLRGSASSVTLRLLEELHLPSFENGDNDEENHSRDWNNSTIISLGLDMLQTLIAKMPYIRPLRSNGKMKMLPLMKLRDRNLEETVELLLSHTLTIASIEVVDTSNNPLKYSSAQVMSMTQTLLGFHNPMIHIQMVAAISQKMKLSPNKVLLPRVLDWLRPVTMEMCQTHLIRTSTPIIRAITGIISPFIHDLKNIFDNSMPPLPRDVPAFMSMAETYTSIFNIIRLLRIWQLRVHTVSPKDKSSLDINDFLAVEELLRNYLKELQTFSINLSRLIDFWSAVESHAKNDRDGRNDSCVDTTSSETIDPPPDWHTVFLLHFALQDALEKPDN